MTKLFKEMTVAEKFQTIATQVQDPEMVAFLNDKAEQQTKRNANRKKTETKAQKENKAIAQKIEQFFLNADKEISYTSKEISQILELDFTPQKMTAILKLVGNIEKVDKATNDKKKVGYKLA